MDYHKTLLSITYNLVLYIGSCNSIVCFWYLNLLCNTFVSQIMHSNIYLFNCSWLWILLFLFIKEIVEHNNKLKHLFVKKVIYLAYTGLINRLYQNLWVCFCFHTMYFLYFVFHKWSEKGKPVSPPAEHPAVFGQLTGFI